MNINVKGLEPRMKVEYKEQIIREVLSEHFTTAELNNVMKYWYRHYSKEPAFVLRKFVTEVCQTPAQQAVKKEIVQQILQRFNKPLSQFIKQERKVSREQLCFEAYLLDILNRLQKQQLEFIDALESKLLSYKFSRSIRQEDNEKHFLQLSLWLKSFATNAFEEEMSPPISSAVDLPVLQVLAEQIYLVLCKVLGPIDADDVVQWAIKRRYSQEQSEEIHRITRL